MLELKIGPSERGMGWLEWSSSIVGSLAWPVAAVIIACLFRSQIAGLLAKLRKFSFGDAEIHFAEVLDNVEANFGQSREPDLREPLKDDRFQQLVEISPSAAILDAWQPIEARLQELGTKLGVMNRLNSTNRRMPPA